GRAFDEYQRWCSSHSRNSSASSSSARSGTVCTRSAILLLVFFLGLDQLEPEEATRCKRKEIRELADPREARVAEQLHRIAALPRRQIELNGLRTAPDVVDTEAD